MLDQLRQEVKKNADPKKAKASAWFFKTGPGQYGEDDKFIGLTVPKIREIAKKFKDLILEDIDALLKSGIHEERLLALIILVNKFQKSSQQEREEIYEFYLQNTKYINNWDLVDSSAHKIVGIYLLDKDRQILEKLAKSKNIWERRIAVISTAQFISKGEFKETFNIAKILLNDKHDLIQKAVGWMLREVGKRVSKDELVKFLAKHYRQMPRTMLRYSIEHFNENTRKKYLRGEI